MLVWRARTGIVIRSLLVAHFRTLINVVGLVKRERAVGSVPLFFHLLACWSNIIASVDDGPANSDVFWRQVRVLSETKRGLIKVIAGFSSFLSSLVPGLIRGIQLLLDNRHAVMTLRRVFVSKYTRHP